jgi:signal transduction histidine kinase
MGHAQWIEEVFANLISNAIKYMGNNNPEPRIAISGIRQGTFVRYEVRDTGDGITSEFSQGNNLGSTLERVKRVG